ncbi:MAG: tetratricopeptide repeat protein, partial [Myxococcota bacterium]
EPAPAETAPVAVVADAAPKAAPPKPAEPPPPAKPSPKKLVSAGWKAIEGGDFEKARSSFEAAVNAGGGSDALYGRGYANEKLGNASGAVSDYCRALSSVKDTDMQREIEGTLRRLGASCG